MHAKGFAPDEPAKRTQSDAAQRAAIAHMRDSRDQRRKDERRDDHLDQPQENRRQDREIASNLLQLRGGRGTAVVDRGIEPPADEQPEHQPEQNEHGQPFGHLRAP